MLKDLARLGPEAYPALARLVQAHDTWLDKRYDQSRARLPVSIRRFLPEDQSKTHFRTVESSDTGSSGEGGPSSR